MFNESDALLANHFNKDDYEQDFYFISQLIKLKVFLKNKIHKKHLQGFMKCQKEILVKFLTNNFPKITNLQI